MTEPSASTKPFSIRLTPEDRLRLEKEAAGFPLGSYIRAKALGEAPPVKLRRSGLPLKDRRSFARLLAVIGRSHLANNLNQIAYLGNIGSLPFTPEIEAELHDALVAVRDLRRLLVTALGLSSEDAA